MTVRSAIPTLTRATLAIALTACAASTPADGAAPSFGDSSAPGDGGAETTIGFDVGSDSTTTPADSSSGDSAGDSPAIDDGDALGETDDTAALGDASGTFGATCGAAGAPKVTGTIYAPNGVDPAPTSFAYAPIAVTPFTPGVACDACDKPIDSVYAEVKTGIDGVFSLDLASVPAAASIKIAFRKGRFRRVITIAPACGKTTALTAADTKLPGATSAGDLPKIAVGTGNSDHLDAILTALGITSFDCYEGRSGSGSSCPTAEATGKKVRDLITDLPTLKTYNLLFISCAPGIWSSYSAADQSAIKANLAEWVNDGGRLIVTDQSYDYVSQSFPSDVSWQGPSGPPWTIGTSGGAGANVGVVPSGGGSGSYTGTVDSPDLTAWLKIVGVAGAPTVAISGWKGNWSVQKSIPTSSTEIVHGTVGYQYPAGSATTTTDLPLTTEFIKNRCGRVIYSSYHTLSSVSASSLTAQERILEYLMLDVASCLRGG